MLARLARELPAGDWLYEPKWDGFRCLASVRGGGVDLRSRHGRPFARYFPELVAALASLGRDCVLDGEVVVVGGGAFDFAALLARLHPAASRVERLAGETPATFIAFDLLADGADDLAAAPFRERRARLERLLAAAPGPLRATPVTADVAVAREWLARATGGGIDGVVAKRPELPYAPGKRVMVKVKPDRTADCAVAGMRLVGGEPAVASLLLGLYDGGALRHVGVASSFTDADRGALYRELLPLATALRGHPWERGFGLEPSPLGRLAGSAGRWDPRAMSLDWTPLRPVRVCEVGYDQLDCGRFRHPARFVRWRPDRVARSCGFDQLALAPAPAAGVLGAAP
jgi:ATP-dependent DNA ligase